MKTITKIDANQAAANSGKKLRVAAYCRVSTDSDEQLESLDEQKKHYESYIQAHESWNFAGLYYDEGISGTKKEKRSELMRLLSDCEAGKIDYIITKSISRFARNTTDCLEMVRKLLKINVPVYFEKENINSMSNDGELMLSILASFAQEESRSISDNVKWGTQKRFKQGIPNGRFNVYGYRWRDTKLEIIPHEAATIKRIYNEYLNGDTPRKIAERLNNENISTINNCRWCDFNVRYILKNVIYTGDMLLQKSFVNDHINKIRKQNNGELPQYFVENNHEPIIDKNIFNKVQNEFVKRSNNRKSVFAQKLKCGICGNRYIRNTCGNPSYKLWVCKTKKNNGCDACNGANIKEERLKEVSAEVLGQDKFDDEIFDEQIKNVVMNGKDAIRFEFYNGNIVAKKWRDI